MSGWLHSALQVVWNLGSPANDDDPFEMNLLISKETVRTFMSFRDKKAEILHLDSLGWSLFLRFGNDRWSFPLWPLTSNLFGAMGLEAMITMMLASPEEFSGYRCVDPFEGSSLSGRVSTCLLYLRPDRLAVDHQEVA